LPIGPCRSTHHVATDSPACVSPVQHGAQRSMLPQGATRTGLRDTDIEHEFAAAIARWQSFQALAGTIAATLLGLLFVAVSIRPTLLGQADHPGFLAVGAKAMGLFMLVIVIALLLQMPDLRPTTLAIVLILMALLSLFNTARQVAIIHQLIEEWGWLFVARRIMLPGCGYVSLLAASVTIYRGETEWLVVVASTQLLFLFTGTYNAWDLLVRAGKS
jgi:hypothetical protein